MNNNDELKQAKFLSVSALNRYLSYKFDMDIHLQTVYLEGEISNFKLSGKHMYFSLKDEFSEISAMMFYPNNTKLNFDCNPSSRLVYSLEISTASLIIMPLAKSLKSIS